MVGQATGLPTPLPHAEHIRRLDQHQRVFPSAILSEQSFLCAHRTDGLVFAHRRGLAIRRRRCGFVGGVGGGCPVFQAVHQAVHEGRLRISYARDAWLRGHVSVDKRGVM